MITCLSLGWGVQSWTLAAMAALGQIEKPNYVVHADTFWERSATYDFAFWRTIWLSQHGIEVIKVSGAGREIGDMSNNVTIPAFTTRLNGESSGMLRRQCTNRWKVRPVRRYLSGELVKLGLKKRSGVVDMWLGITTDEIQRMKDSDVQWINNVYPLVDLNMSRADCESWLKCRKLEIPPKSSCVFCPYQSKSRWFELRKSKDDWEAAVMVDEAIRNRRENFISYVHPDRIPLTELKSAEDYGASQLALDGCDSGYCFN